MRPILNIQINDRPTIAIGRHLLPLHRQWSTRLDGPATIHFEDEAGVAYRHNLPPNPGWLLLTVFVDANLTCQASALVTPRPARDPEARVEDDEIAVRFQPFFLAGADDMPDLTGQGLFARGLHFGGTITPSSTLLSCRCDACGQSFLGQSNHTGWLEQTYFYSESGRFTLLTDIRVGEANVGQTEPDYASMEALEKALPPAPDGSKFSYSNPFRCPHCAAPYIDFQKYADLHDREYYLLRLVDIPLLHFP